MPNSAAIRLLDLIQSHRVTAVIYVAAKLGIADLLREGPRSLDQLATATGAQQGALGRLLAALSAVGICVRVPPDGYSLTELGLALDGSADRSVKAWAIFEGEMLSKSWSGMLESIMTGKTAAQLQGFDSSFELMSRSPENIGIFNAAMADLTRLVTPDILHAFDFSQISHLMDVGGGTGELIGAIAKQYPNIRGIVFDLPRCEPTAQEHLQRLGVSDRAMFVSGNFFETIPSIADAIILKSVIHDWNDEHSSRIFRNCHRALPRDGTLLLVERVLPEMPTASDVDKAHIMSDLNMLCGPGGLERSERQYRLLLEQTGFCQKSLVSAGLFSVIEARAN
jgi:DNA-binding HxlR family transcriptional regulator